MNKIKRILKFVLLCIGSLLVFFFLTFLIRKIRVESEPKKIYSTNFTVIYTGILESEAEGILQSLELNYERIRAELNDSKHSKFSVFIHSNQNDCILH